MMDLRQAFLRSMLQEDKMASESDLTKRSKEVQQMYGSLPNLVQHREPRRRANGSMAKWNAGILHTADPALQMAQSDNSLTGRQPIKQQADRCFCCCSCPCHDPAMSGEDIFYSGMPMANWTVSELPPSSGGGGGGRTGPWVSCSSGGEIGRRPKAALSRAEKTSELTRVSSEEDFVLPLPKPSLLYSSTSCSDLRSASKLSYRSSIRMMVRPEHLREPRAESAERAMIRAKKSTSKPPDQASVIQRAVVKEQFRLPRDLLEKMPSASNSPALKRKSVQSNSSSAEIPMNKQPGMSVASMVRRFELSDGSKTRGAGFKSSDNDIRTAVSRDQCGIRPETPISSRTSSLSSSQGLRSPERSSQAAAPDNDATKEPPKNNQTKSVQKQVKKKNVSTSSLVVKKEQPVAKSRMSTSSLVSRTSTPTQKVTTPKSSSSVGAVARAKSALTHPDSSKSQVSQQKVRASTHRGSLTSSSSIQLRLPNKKSIGGEKRPSLMTDGKKSSMAEDNKKQTVLKVGRLQTSNTVPVKTVERVAPPQRSNSAHQVVKKKKEVVEQPALLRVKTDSVKSLDNLSTHVNSPSSDPVSPVPSPETSKRRSSGSSDMSSPGDAKVDSASEDDDAFTDPVRNKFLSGVAQAGSSRVKRCESDGIVVAERPKPDIPVRRCESIDDASELGRGTDQPAMLFPQNIKTVSSATIVKGPEDMTHVVGETVHFRAHYFGNPEPRVTWLKSGRRVLPTEDRISIKTYSGESTLIVRDLRPDDAGKYELIIENEMGNDAVASSLAVEGPPEPPAGRPYVSDIEGTSLTLSWYGPTFDGGTAITGYLIEMASWDITSDSRPPDATDWKALTSSCNSTSFIVKGLDPDREYIFRVKAENVHGLSPPGRVSEPVSFKSSKDGDEPAEGVTGSGSAELDDDPFVAPFEHRLVALEEGAIFKSKFEIYEELGRGRFGVVFKVKDKDTSEHFAAKFVRCRKSDEKQKVKDEITIMNILDYNRLLQLAAAYENPREIIMVMEYIGGGELFEKVVADDFTLTERDCMLFMRQICSAVGYMHQNDIVHLDLKPENILCKSKKSHQIKIIDFGLARKLKSGEDVRILFGTPEFVSPEVISYEPVSTASDMWSVGVVCYVLLSGLSPFMGDSDVETFANISGIYYDFDDDAFEPISDEAKDFIKKLLIKSQKKRLNAEDCLKHVWLAQADSGHEKKWKEINTEKLKSFLMRRRWQKAAHAIRALGRFTSLGFRQDSRDSASSVTAMSTQSADF